MSGSEESSPSLAEIIGAAHSDLASSYVLVASSSDYRLVFKQAKRLLGGRVELVLADTFENSITALKKFSSSLSTLENAKLVSQF